ncbi:MAG: DUF4340 domain-containing protein [Candidatus Omnitrophica bacterium]|nr:DUF4340 domain-containing protein [Candidatus Omnitrophota bacterium]
MKLKNLIILGTVFICLMAVILLKKNITPEIPVKEELYDMIPSPISLDVIGECHVAIKHPPTPDGKDMTELKFKKEGDSWILENVYNIRVNEEEFEKFIEKLDDLKGEFRSDKKELFEDYGITDEGSVHIILRGTDAEEIVHLVVGTKKPDWGHNFVRDAGSSDVYMANKNILALLGFWERVIPEEIDKKRWINLDMAGFDPEQIVSVKISDGAAAGNKNILNITRKLFGDKKEWTAAQGYSFKLDSNKVMEYLKTIRQTKVNEVSDPKETEHFSSSDWILTLGTAEGEKITFTRGEKQAADAYYFKVSGKDHDFIIPLSTFKDFDKKETDFFDKNIFDLNEENVKKLNIRGASKRKKYTAIKNIEENLWETKKGAALDNAKVKGVIQSLENISVKIFPERNVPKKNVLTYEITKTDGQTLKFAVSKEVTIDEKEYYCLKIENASPKYYIENDTLKNLNAALQNLS